MAIYLTFIAIVLLFFPFSVDGYLNYDAAQKRLNFIVLLQKIIKLKGGYIDKSKGNFVIHTANNRAYLFDRKKLGNFKLKNVDFSQIWLTNLSAVCFIPFSGLSFGLLGVINVIENLVLPIINTNLQRVEQIVQFTENEDISAYLKISIKVNLFAIIYLLIYMWVKGEKAKQKR